MQENNTITLTFTPAIPCFKCERLTTVAQLDEHHLGFLPQCAEHGFQWQCSVPAQFESVAQFVMFKFEQIGTCKVLNQCSLSDVPGYKIEHDRFTDIAWAVMYEHKNEQLPLWVVWYTDGLTFELYHR